MRLEAFYDADERRRRSPEVAFGLAWTTGDPPSGLADLYWIQDTGELYLMHKPRPREWLPVVDHERVREWVEAVQDVAAGAVEEVEELFVPRHRLAKRAGERALEHAEEREDTEEDDIDVEVLATVPSRADVDRLLDGWQEAILRPDSVRWLRERVASLERR
jgi:hypothetical protein